MSDKQKEEDQDSLRALNEYFTAIAKPMMDEKVNRLFRQMEKSLRVVMQPKPWYMSEKRWKKKAARYIRLEFLFPSYDKEIPNVKKAHL